MSLLLALGLAAGASTFGSAISGQLSRRIGIFGSACVFLLVGSFLALITMVIMGEAGQFFFSLSRVPWIYLVPGIVNMATVALGLSVLMRLGSGTAVTGLFLGQMLGGLVLDEIGAFGQPLVQLTLPRVIGTLIAVAGLRLLLDRRVVEGHVGDGHFPVFWVGIAVVSGGAASILTALNARLGYYVGPVGAVFAFFLPGAVVLSGLWMRGVLDRPISSLHQATWWSLVLPGAINFMFLWLIIRGVLAVGVGTTVAVAFSMRMVAALAVDSLGLFGLLRLPLSVPRVVGVILMFLGVLLVYP